MGLKKILAPLLLIPVFWICPAAGAVETSTKTVCNEPDPLDCASPSDFTDELAAGETKGPGALNPNPHPYVPTPFQPPPLQAQERVWAALEEDLRGLSGELGVTLSL